MIDDLIRGNETFRAQEFALNRELYKKLAAGQSPQVLWLGCSDSRVSPEKITTANPGELFVQRNIGNIVPANDWNLSTVLEYAIVHLHVKEIVVCGHAGCGAIRALDKESSDAYIPLWLNNAVEAKRRVDAKRKAPANPQEADQRYREIEEENVRLQLEHLMTYPIVKKAVDSGQIRLQGLYYDLADGTLSKLR
ncbi:MAG: carbonic anhydrase [Methanomicrobiales archaeon]|nr:carbonic anhydrase [Methanomicrobiales archaeon]